MEDVKRAKAASEREDGWLTVSEAESLTAIDSGLISRAANEGKLKTYGKTGRERRIEPASLVSWALGRIPRDKPEPNEEVEKKMREVDPKE